MPRKKKNAEESAAPAEQPIHNSAEAQPEDKPVKRPRTARKTKKSEEGVSLPAVAPAHAAANVSAGEEEASAQAADTFEEAFEDRAGARPHTIDPNKVDAIAAPADKAAKKSRKGKKAAEAEEEAIDAPVAAQAEDDSDTLEDDEEDEDAVLADDDEDENEEDKEESDDEDSDELEDEDEEDDEEDRAAAAKRADLPPARQDRLQKILAQAGIASRRHAEELITEGRVQVNGKVVTELGSKADPNRDHIRVDGKLLHGAERLRYFMLNKPKGYVTTVSDPEGRQTVMEFFSKFSERLYPVGRLDYLSEGLLLVTNDGELANQLTRAASGVEKIYLVKVAGQPEDEDIERLREGVMIERGAQGEGRVRTSKARIKQVRYGENPWFEVILTEGRNRELRKMFEEIGHHVEKIRRVGYGPLELDIEPGTIRELFPEEVQALRNAAAGKKLKQRRFKATDMLPKEAGRSVDHDADDRRKGKFHPRSQGDRSATGGARFGQRPAGSFGSGAGREDRRPPVDRGTRAPSRGGAGFGARSGQGTGSSYRSADRPSGGARPTGGDRPERTGSGFGARRPAGSAFSGANRGDRPMRTGGSAPDRRGSGAGGRDFQRPPRQENFRPRPAADTGADSGGEATAKPRRLYIEEDRGHDRTQDRRPARTQDRGSDRGFRPRQDQTGERRSYQDRGGQTQRPRAGTGEGARRQDQRAGQGGQRREGFGGGRPSTGRSGPPRTGSTRPYTSRPTSDRRPQGRDFRERGEGTGDRPARPGSGRSFGPRSGEFDRGASGGGQGRGFSRPPQGRSAEGGAPGERPRSPRPPENRGFAPRGGGGGARPAGSRPTGSRPTGSRPAASRAAGSRPTGSGSRSGGPRPGGSRPGGPRGGRPGGGRPGGSRPGGRPSGGSGKRRH